MKLKAPDNCGGFHAEGIAFEIAADGTIDVPEHLVPVAKSHGFGDLAPVVTPLRNDVPRQRGKRATTAGEA
jgi:hypothetical protein